MQTQRLGTTDLVISTIGFGTFALGGEGWPVAWGPQDDNDSIVTIHRAIDLGINWIDTAAVYGFGHAEEVTGRALKGMSQRPYLFTKCSRVPGPDGKIQANLKAASIFTEVEQSLRRLQVDVIDLYQVHWPFPDEDIEEGWTALAHLQQQGKVRFIGVSNFSVSQMQRAQAIAPLASLQPPYSLIRRDIEPDILPYCAANQIGVIVYSPMASGLLTGKWNAERVRLLPESDWRRRSPDYQEPRLQPNLALAELLAAIGERHGLTAGAVAIAWTLRQPAVTGAIVGGRRPDQLDEIIAASDFRLSQDELDEIAAAL